MFTMNLVFETFYGTFMGHFLGQKRGVKMKKQNKIIHVLIISAIVLAIAVLVFAQTNEGLESEKALLEQELTDADYSWLINYSVDENLDSASIEVYESNGNNSIAVFENITSENWHKVYLTGLKGTHDTFDLKVLNSAIEFDYIVDPEANGWFNSSWNYRKNITIDHTKVNGTQTNFPVLINISDSDLASDALANGDDIVFTNSTGSKLDYEIESYSSGNLAAWVRVPSLSGDADTVIQMYYGNADASNQENASGVWDSSYKGVWHLDEASGTAYDSTSNSENLTETSGTIPTATGQIGNARDFELGDTEYLTHADGGSTDISGANQYLSIVAWIKPESIGVAGEDQYIVAKYSAGDTQRQYNIHANVKIDGQYSVTGKISSDGSATKAIDSTTQDYTAGAWHHVVMVYECQTV